MKTKLFFIFALGAFVIKAQTYSITPAKTMTVNAPNSIVTIFDIYQKNTSASKIVLKWEKVLINLPATWQYSMCDLGTCYPGIPAGPNTMDTVPGNGQGFLGLNIDPGTVGGSGIVKVFVYQNGFRSNGDTLTWYINAAAVGIEEITANSAIKIYPNPTQNNLNINLNGSENMTVNLIDALGRKVLTQAISGSNTIDVSILDKGVYTLLIETKDNQMFKRIIKE